jgi:GTPase SAR1 family protein
MNRHYRKAVGGFVVYDVTKKATFDSVVRWVRELRANADPSICIMLIGNKSDLCDEDPTLRQVDTAEAAVFAERNGMLFAETSAVVDTNVKGAFEELLQSMMSLALL